MLSLNSLRKHSVPIVLSYDIFAVVSAWWIAFFIRYDFRAISFQNIEHGLKAQCFLVASQLFFYWYYKTYRPLWRFFSIPELSRLFKAIFSAWVCNIAVLYALHDLIQIPKSIWFIYPLWLILILGLGRLTIRNLSDKQVVSSEIKRMLVIGAGKGAELFLRELRRLPEKQLEPIACLDDNVSLKGKEIRGIPILGGTVNLAEIVKSKNIDWVVIAIPSISSVALRNIVDICEKIPVQVRVLPSLAELQNDKLHKLEPRDVSLEDLLGRDTVELDSSETSSFLTNEIVLVSGGGGSIGSELCHQILQLNPKKLIIVDHAEFNLYEVEQQLLSKGYSQIHTALLTIADKLAVEQVMQQYQPTVVFHAAAYKHVPMLEYHPIQAIKNNIIGTKILAETSAYYGVKKFVMVSTDKAVNPTNIMGASKRIAELFCQSLNHTTQTAFVTVRFGNVIGSAGSVIPLFKKQIANGQPITVTHPDITRYFMTIREASQLILQAGAQGEGGEIFVLDMGKPIKIVELAKLLLSLSGEKAKGIDIVYTGLRPGEKMHEELFYNKEQLHETKQKKIFKTQTRHLINYHAIAKACNEIEIQYRHYSQSDLVSWIQTILGDEGQFLSVNKKTVQETELV